MISGTDTPATPSVAVVMPVLNEAATLPAALEQVRAASPEDVIVVDGGSVDATHAVATAAGDGVRVLQSARGRSIQMNAGAAIATADILLFLHVDTRLPPRGLEYIRAAVHAGHVWGRFDVRLDNSRWPYRVIEWFMNRRSALSGVATGDQAIFVRRDIFEKLGGYPDIALMEDIALSAKLRRVAWPVRVTTTVTASTRRWERHGIARTVMQMWGLRLLYWIGVSPSRLARWYA